MPEPIRVLYVDDEPDLLELGKLFLEATTDFDVDTLTSAGDTLATLPEKQYDAIISDYQMPGMDGIAFLKAVRASGNTIPFILFTGRGREEVVIEAINNGGDFYLQKGGDPKAQFAELAHKVRQAVQRRMAEASIRDHERREADIINFLPDATFAIDRAGTVIAWNRAIEEMTGVPASAMLGRGNGEYAIPFYGTRRRILIDLIFESDEVIAEKYAHIIHEKDILIADTTIPRPRGRTVTLMGKASPLYNQKGEIIGAIESIRDITDKKLAEDELLHAKRDWETIFRAVGHPAMVLDAQQRIIEVNDATLNVTGKTPDELKRLRCFEVFHGKGTTQPPDNCPFEALRKSGSSETSEMEVQTLNGIYSVTCTPVYDNEGNLEKVIHIALDVTERRRTEDELRSAYEQIAASEEELRGQFDALVESERKVRESEAKFRSLVDKSLDGIVITDLDGTIVYVNPRIGEIIESTSSQDLVGRANILNLVTPSFREQAAGDLARVQAGVDNFPVSYTITTFADKEVWVECIGRIISYESKPALLLSIRDITSRKLTETSLNRANEKLGLLSQITRHDILNQLMVLDSYCILLSGKIADSSGASELLQKIRKASAEIKERIGFTKDYQDLGKNKPVWQDIPLIARMAADGVIAKTVSLDIFTGEVEIFADPMLMLVFYNLFENAIRHGKTVTRMSITFLEKGKEGLLIIEDNGIGIPAARKAGIFERGVGSNTGLGLFLVREILGITDITIHETGQDGSGARFEILVPQRCWRMKPGEPR